MENNDSMGFDPLDFGFGVEGGGEMWFDGNGPDGKSFYDSVIEGMIATLMNTGDHLPLIAWRSSPPAPDEKDTVGLILIPFLPDSFMQRAGVFFEAGAQLGMEQPDSELKEVYFIALANSIEKHAEHLLKSNEPLEGQDGVTEVAVIFGGAVDYANYEVAKVPDATVTTYEVLRWGDGKLRDVVLASDKIKGATGQGQLVLEAFPNGYAGGQGKVRNA